MKKILLLIAVAFNFSIYAQDVALSDTATKQDSCYVYAVLSLDQSRKDYSIYLNYGMENKLIAGPFSKDVYNSWVAALNHISVDGWELMRVHESLHRIPVTGYYTPNVIEYCMVRKRISAKDMHLYYRSNGQ
jgi:hypothetical protein